MLNAGMAFRTSPQPPPDLNGNRSGSGSRSQQGDAGELAFAPVRGMTASG